MTGTRFLLLKLLILLQVLTLVGFSSVQGNANIHVKAVHEVATDHHHHGLSSVHFEKDQDTSKHQDHSHHNLPVWISLNKTTFLSFGTDRKFGFTSLSAVEDISHNGLYRPPKTAS